MSAAKLISQRKLRAKSGYRMGNHLPEICHVKFKREQWNQLAASAGFSVRSRAKNRIRTAYSRYLSNRVALQFYPHAREVAASLSKVTRYVDDVASRLQSLQHDPAFDQAQSPPGNIFGLDVEIGVYNIDPLDRVALTEVGHHAHLAYVATCDALNALQQAEAKYRELADEASERIRFLEKELKPKSGRISRDEFFDAEISLLTCLAREMANRSLSVKLGSTSSTTEKWKSYPYPKAATVLLTFALNELPNHAQAGTTQFPPAHFANNLLNGSSNTFLRVLGRAREKALDPAHTN